MSKISKCVGLDVYKDSISIVVAEQGGNTVPGTFFPLAAEVLEFVASLRQAGRVCLAPYSRFQHLQST